MNGFLVLAAEAGEGGNSFLLSHDLAEVFWSGLASLLVIGFLCWKGLPFAASSLRARSERIAKEIDDAEQDHRTGEERLADAQARVAGAEAERDGILADARETAEALKRQIIARAETEAGAVRERGAADIEASKQQAIADLRAEIAELAVGAAEAVVASNLDAGTHSDLIDGYIDQLAGSGGGAR